MTQERIKEVLDEAAGILAAIKMVPEADRLDALAVALRAVDSAFAAGVAAGRAQAAADIRASIPEVASYVWDASAPYERDVAAIIAEGGDAR